MSIIHIWIGTTHKTEEEYLKYFELDYSTEGDFDDPDYKLCPFCKDINQRWYDEDLIGIIPLFGDEYPILQLLETIPIDKNEIEKVIEYYNYEKNKIRKIIIFSGLEKEFEIEFDEIGNVKNILKETELKK